MITYEAKIKDICDLIHVMKSVNAGLGGQIWWRGQANTGWELKPSIFREKYSKCGYEYEINFTYRFMQKAPALREYTPAKNAWFDWLFLMQHYGLPTRLLDWTESPLIACYFAVQNFDDCAGALYALNPHELNKCEGMKYALLTPENKEAKVIAQGGFDSTANAKHKVLAILPDLIDARMSAQLSVFTIHNDDVALDDHPSESEFLMKFEIPFEAKADLREQLKHAGIRQSSIFPDLQHLAEEVKTMKFKNLDDPYTGTISSFGQGSDTISST